MDLSTATPEPLRALLREVGRPPEVEVPRRAGDRIGRFELLHELGRGGFGVVYTARDTELGRLVAVKVARPRADPDRMDRFRQEAEAVARLNHPNVVTIHDAGESDGAPFVVLELLDGETLARRLDRGSLAPRAALALMIDVARALACAHEAGIIHRDLKPANVFVTADGRIKVLDFGLAWMMDRPRPPGGEGQPPEQGGTWPTAGTPEYMSPEQLRGEAQDPRTDVYAAGVMFIELLTGAPPRSLEQAETAPARTAAAPPTSDGVPPELTRLADRMTAPMRTDRFAGGAELLAALLEAERALAAAPRAGEQPYRYLQAFDESDDGWFFGRAGPAARLAGFLARHPLAAVVGASGAGKSSLVKAGLLAQLRRDGPWELLALRPGNEPVAALRAALAARCGDDVVADIVELAARPGLVGQALRDHARARQARVLVFVDQLEELFTQCDDRAARQAFAAMLLASADDRDAPVRVVVAMREELLSRLGETPALRDAVTAGILLLGPPDVAGVAEAIAGPARRLGFELEAGLVDEMVAALAGEAAPLPLLQLAASRLWEQRDVERRRIGRAVLDRLGGVAGVLAAHAREVVSGLAGEQARLVPRLLCRLVTADGTRRSVERDELVSLGPAAGPALDRLIDGRLLTTTSSARGERIELAHESLTTKWEQLGDWLAEEREHRRALEHLVQAASLWHERGQPDDLLWRDRTLADAVLLGDAITLARPERAFVEAAVGLRRRRSRRRRALVALAGAAAVATVLGLVWSTVTARRAARSARVQALIKTAVAERDPLIGALLLAELPAEREPPGAVAAAHAVLGRPIPRAVWRFTAPFTGPVTWSADDDLLLATTADGVARLLRADGTGRPYVVPVVVRRAELTRRGDVVTESDDGQVRVWRPGATAPSQVIPGSAVRLGGDHAVILAGGDASITTLGAPGPPVVVRGPFVDAVPSGDGERVVTTSADGTVRVWTAAGVELATWSHPSKVRELAISHDGSQVATADKDTLRLWTAGGQPRTIEGVAVVAPGFSPDGRWLMTAARALFPRLELLRTDGSAEPLQLPEFERAAWAPARERLAVSAADGLVEVYRVDGSGSPLQLRGHEGSVTAVAFDHRGAHLATAAADGTLRVWSTVPGGGQVNLHAGEPGVDMVIDTVRFSPDGTRLLTAAHDGTARILRTDGEGEPIVLRHDQNVHSAEWTTDGSRVVSAATDRAWLWPTAGGEPRMVADPADDITLASLSPDESRVAVGTVTGAWIVDVASGRSREVGRRVTTNDLRWRPDGTLILSYPHGVAEVVPVESGGAARELVAGGDYARLALSADGATMVSGALDSGELRVWRGADLAEDAARRRQIPGLSAVAMSADGRRLAAGTQRDADLVWRSVDEPPLELGGATDTVFALAFSPDGRRVAAGSADGYVRIYELEWRPLAAALDRATTACLPVDARVAHLGESRATAGRRVAACERRHQRAE